MGDGVRFGETAVGVVVGGLLAGVETAAVRTIRTGRVVGRRILAFPEVEKYQVALVASGQVDDVVVGRGLQLVVSVYELDEASPCLLKAGIAGG